MDRDIICGRVGPEDEDEACRKDREGQAHSHHDAKRRSTHSAAAKDDDDEDTWPKVRSWVEGHKLVLEYQKSYSDDPDVQVIPLTDAERSALEASDTPAQDWGACQSRRAGVLPGRQQSRILERFRGHLKAAREQGAQLVAHQEQEALRQGRGAQGRGRRAERDERVNLMYGAMTWAQGHREHQDDLPLRSSRRQPSISPARDADAGIHHTPAVVSTLHDDGRGGRPIGPEDSSVPPGSTSAQDSGGRAVCWWWLRHRRHAISFQQAGQCCETRQLAQEGALRPDRTVRQAPVDELSAGAGGGRRVRDPR
ncbi:hypothetical protein L1887_43383 [Cichorium endivia]|nr:hypothetical protein L1887_43383 [Cichorium endivia]